MNKDDDKKHWKLGMFYYNPDDPSESVERKNGLGSTINFASKLGRLIFAFIFIPPIMIMLVFIIVMLLK
ncbi:DUF5808 domain-containing protein [Clostridium sp.]|uniref:DUF5808 domain-containing protein n=1 Tax=Clostridium sp. TaxID=1506 RepID=UPI0039C5C233